MRRMLIIGFIILYNPCIGQEKISDQQIAHLNTLGKVWGFLKYYHPAVTKGKHDWDNQLLENIPKVLSCSTTEEVNTLLNGWIMTLGKISKQTSYEFENEVKLHPPNQWIHNEELLGEELSSALIFLENAKRGKKSHYIKYENSQSEFINEKSYPDYEGDHSGINLLALFRYWNIIQYFYPYRYLTKDWDAVLTKYIPRFHSVDNSLKYKLLIKELAAEINDAHANTYEEELKNFFGSRGPAIDVRMVEDQYVVYRLLPGFEHNHQLKAGSIITHIDEENISEKINSLYKYIPSSNRAGKEFGAIQMALRTNKNVIKLTSEDGETTLLETHEVDKISPHWLKIPSNKILEGNIGYFYPGSVEPGTIDDIFLSFSDTRGLVVDLRCYPSHYLFDMFKYISNDYDEYLLSTSGNISMPGLFTFDRITGKVIANSEYYKNKIILLVDELTLSQSESYAMAFQVNPKTTIIGSTTAGADGDAVAVILPGNVMTTITSWGAYYPDGRETQGVGIEPDIQIRPSIEGLRSGSDELLELAVKLINGDN